MFGSASDRAISIDPPPTDCRSATEPSLDWRNLLTTPGWRSRDSCQHAGEVKWFGAEEWFPSNRTADLARDGRNVVPGCLERQGSAVRPPAASPFPVRLPAWRSRRTIAPRDPALAGR